jgi:hypothetical protein
MRKLHEIIEANDNNEYVSFENYMIYIRSLYTYYKDYYCDEPVAMITNVSNTGGCMRIVSSYDFDDAVCEEIGVNYIIENENDKDFDFDIFAEYEAINANSRMLYEFLNVEV